MREGFAGAFKGADREKFDKMRQKQAEVLGYKLTGKSDIRTEIDDATVHQIGQRLQKEGKIIVLIFLVEA